MLSKATKSALTFSVTIFVGAILVDPGDHVFHLKLPMLLLVMGLWICRILFGFIALDKYEILNSVLLFAIIVPGIATLIGLLGDSPLDGDPTFQLMKQVSVILIIPVLASERIDISKHIIRWCFIVAGFTILLAALSFTAPLLFGALRDFAVNNDNAFITDYDKLGVGVGSFYYKTIAVLIFPAAYYLNRFLYSGNRLSNGAAVMLFLIALLCAGSRAIALCTFVLVAIYLFEKLWTKEGLVISLFLMLIVLYISAGYFMSFFHSSESSNAAKLDHIHSYEIEFTRHPTYLLWGQGADTQFYSEGFQDKTTLTELTYIEMVRWFGFPVAVLLLFIICFPAALLMIRGDETSFMVGPFWAYLLESASNPLLICSTGLLIVSALWACVLMQNTGKRGNLAS